MIHATAPGSPAQRQGYGFQANVPGVGYIFGVTFAEVESIVSGLAA